jgi:hypothetical protein
MPRARRLPHEVKEGIEEVTAYLLSNKRPMRHALGIADTIRTYGATPERMDLLFNALEQVAAQDETALDELRRLRRFGGNE